MEQKITRSGVNYFIRHRERATASPRDGFRQKWTEYQVMLGNKIVSRHDTYAQAERALADLRGRK